MCEAIPNRAADYVGLRFRACGRDRSGLDCWGLLITVLREQFGKVIPPYDGISFEEGCDRATLAAFMHAHKTDWIEVPSGEEQPGDGILLRMMGHPIHVAVVVARGCMLHIEQGSGA